jgi:hypothetical protein
MPSFELKISKAEFVKKRVNQQNVEEPHDWPVGHRRMKRNWKKKELKRAQQPHSATPVQHHKCMA